MKYLSDKILVRYTIPSGTPYVNYNVNAKSVRGAYSQPIFTGRVYNTGVPQFLYLNDIIKNYMFNDSMFEPNEEGSPFSNDYNINNQMSKFEVEFSGIATTVETDWILPYYKDANLPDGELKTNSFDPENDNVANVAYPLTERTSLIPRIPHLTTANNKFWFFTSVIPTTLAWHESEADGDPVFVISSDDPNVEDLEFDHVNYSWGVKLTNTYIHNMTQGSKIYIGQYNDPENPLSHDPIKVQVANVDECPAPFYLIWMDRTGAYQCQPFSKRTDYSENITSTNTTNFLGEERPCEKDVTSQWVLHTDWMDESSHKAHESILTSPWIYLYDAKNDMGWYVNCTDSSWTDKIYKNGKKMFYLTINLKSISNQEMIY